MQQRSDIIAFEFISTAQKIQFYDKIKPDDLAADAFHQIDDRPSSSAGCKQIVNDQNLMAFANCIFVPNEPRSTPAVSRSIQ